MLAGEALQLSSATVTAEETSRQVLGVDSSQKLAVLIVRIIDVGSVLEVEIWVAFLGYADFANSLVEFGHGGTLLHEVSLKCLIVLDLGFPLVQPIRS